MQKSSVLDIPINALSASEEFKRISFEMGFGSLREILSKTPKDLLNVEHFSYIWLEELITILRRYDVLHLFQARQGNSKL
jgi:hypothetical protein